MADDEKISVRFKRNEEDLKTAFAKVLAEERKRDPGVAGQTVAKLLIRRGLDADTKREQAAAIAANELAAVRGQVNQIAQSVRKLETGIGAIRADLASTVLVLLEHAGKLSATKARKWVEEEFKS